MSHTDYIAQAPQGFQVVAHSDVCPVAAMEDAQRRLYAYSFIQRCNIPSMGKICCTDFSMMYAVARAVGYVFICREYRRATPSADWRSAGDLRIVGRGGFFIAAVLVHKAVGKQLTCIFVDHGLLRKNEGDEVERVFP